MTTALTEALVNTGQFENEDEAFLKAFEMANQAKGKTREDAIRGMSIDLMKASFDQTPEAQKKAIENATLAYDSVQPLAEEGGAAPVGQQNALVPDARQIALLQANPDKALEFDAVFGEGAAALILGEGAAQPQPQPQAFIPANATGTIQR